MEFVLPITIKKLPTPITYLDKILLVGSCFTEHIGNSLHKHKFQVLQNPHGILFDPVSVCKSLISYTTSKNYTMDHLFNHNEVWHSWQHHSRYSNLYPEEALKLMNNAHEKAQGFLREAGWLIITLGSSFSYRLTELAPGTTGESVANCHRAPAQWFARHLLDTTEIIARLEDCTAKLKEFNPQLKIIYTISPVRHVRDGVVENNRSKSRLIEAVHHMVATFDQQYYFPAYELVIDVLRDYRFYDIDLVHPNYAATEFVLDHFAQSCIGEQAALLMEEIKKLVIARNHRAFQPDTLAHRQFLAAQYKKALELKQLYPFLDLSGEIEYFSRT